jgi:hypothetical protein
MLNGRIIGVYEGSLDDFENATGTAYAAPHPSLPLLFSMQEQGGQTQAKYYTNDTPLSEVDSTLTDGKFTGYIELSENVLSGDYYVAYYGGRSMSVAFVGASEQVVTGEDAFERANDEVGIYEVQNVDIEVTDVPDPDEPDETPGETSGATTGGASEASDAGTVSDAGGVSDATDGSSGPTGASETAADTGLGGSGRNDAAADTSPGGQSSSASQSHTGQTAEATPDSGVSESEPTASEGDQSSTAQNRSATVDTDSGTRATRTGVTDANASDTSAGASGAGTDDAGQQTAEVAGGGAVESVETAEPESSAEPVRPEAGRSRAQTDAAPDSESERAGGDAFDEEEQWREATTIPSLDPDRSEGPDEEAVDGSSQSATAEGHTESASATAGQSRSDDAASSEPASPERASRRQSEGAPSEASSGGSNSRTGAQTGTSEQSGTGSHDGSSQSEDRSGGRSGESSEKSRAKIQELRSQLRQRKQQVQKLKDRLSNVESERNEYKRERNALRQEVERLEAKLETTGSAGSSGGRQLSRSQAFDGTNLFVRYESKGEATLEEAAEGQAKPEDVNANLRLEHHTQFETEAAEVEGEPFEAFLRDSFEYRFVSWVIEELLYDIRDTGHRNSLKDLYESIPKIDRVDFHGSVGAGGDSEGTRQESFNVIMRDRMGNPLMVADLNDSRDPTTGDMMGSLVDASSGVAQAHDELSGAFQVTESFFEPKALETAENATAGGFLSREKRESFVKLSRKRGYHLCLVESRSGGFHLNVPEL